MKVLVGRNWPLWPLAVAAITCGCVTPKPHVAPPAGVYGCPVTVTITDVRPQAKIFYTSDGADPTVHSTAYSGPFPLSAGTKVRAIAVVPGGRPSNSVNIDYSCAMTRGEFAVRLQQEFKLAAPSHPAALQDVEQNRRDYTAIRAAAPYMNAQVLCLTCYLSPKFYPGEAMSREILALAVVRVLIAQNKIQLVSEAESNRLLAQVRDAQDLPPASRPYFATAMKFNILSVTDQRINPTTLETEQDASSVLEAAGQRFNSAAGAAPGTRP